MGYVHRFEIFQKKFTFLEIFRLHSYSPLNRGVQCVFGILRCFLQRNSNHGESLAMATTDNLSFFQTARLLSSASMDLRVEECLSQSRSKNCLSGKDSYSMSFLPTGIVPRGETMIDYWHGG